MKTAAPRPSSDRKLRRALVTPEGFDLGITIASAGARLGALMIDLGILFVIFLIVVVLLVITSFSALAGGGEAAPVLVMIALFVLRNGWFLGFECGKRAATPGKRLMGLRVVSRDGGALDVDQVIARNLMREIELFLPLTMLGLGDATSSLGGWTVLFGMLWALGFTLFPLFNADRMRVGDLLAGTWVIQTAKEKIGEDLTRPQFDRDDYAFTRAHLSAYGVAELTRLEDVLRRRDDAQMWVVADAIRRKIDWQDQAADAESFLSAYYAGLRGHLERDLLFGWKRTDKFDTRGPVLPGRIR